MKITRNVAGPPISAVKGICPTNKDPQNRYNPEIPRNKPPEEDPDEEHTQEECLPGDTFYTVA